MVVCKMKFKYLKIGGMLLQVFDFFQTFHIDVVNILT